MKELDFGCAKLLLRFPEEETFGIGESNFTQCSHVATESGTNQWFDNRSQTWTKLSPVMSKFNIHQAKTQLSRLVDLAASGEEIIIAKSGKPVARLVPYTPKGAVRRPGVMRGKIRIKKNF